MLGYCFNVLFPHLSLFDQYAHAIFYEVILPFRCDACIFHVRFTYNDKGYAFQAFFTNENQPRSPPSRYLLLYHGLVAILH